MPIFDEFQTDMADTIQEVGEDIVYKPYGGSPRTIRAFVERGIADVSGLTPGSVAIVYVLNDRTTGIPSAQLDRGRDKVSVSHRHGGTAQDRTIGEILQQNPAFMQLELR